MFEHAKTALIDIIKNNGIESLKRQAFLKAALLDYRIEKKEINILIAISRVYYFEQFLVNVLGVVGTTADSALEKISYEKMVLYNSVLEEYDFEAGYVLSAVTCWANVIAPVSSLGGDYELPGVMDILDDGGASVPLFAGLIKYLLGGSTQGKAEQSAEPERGIESKPQPQLNTYLLQHTPKEVMKLAQGNDPEARYQLGLMYERGEFVNSSYREAIKWYKLSALLDYSEAAFRLGQIYESGKIIEQNIEEASRWYKTAKELGHKLAAKKIKGLKKKRSRTKG